MSSYFKLARRNRVTEGRGQKEKERWGGDRNQRKERQREWSDGRGRQEAGWAHEFPPSPPLVSLTQLNMANVNTSMRLPVGGTQCTAGVLGFSLQPAATQRETLCCLLADAFTDTPHVPQRELAKRCWA